ELPADELNTKIDELFVRTATNMLPQTASEFQSWRTAKLAELQRIVFRSLPERSAPEYGIKLNSRKVDSGALTTEPGIYVSWKFFPAADTKSGRALWLVPLAEDESLDSKPEWLTRFTGDGATLLIAPCGSGPSRWQDPAPFYIQRSLPLLGRTVDSC